VHAVYGHATAPTTNGPNVRRITKVSDIEHPHPGDRPSLRPRTSVARESNERGPTTQGRTVGLVTVTIAAQRAPASLRPGWARYGNRGRTGRKGAPQSLVTSLNPL